MNVTDPGDPLLPPSKEGRHTSARERQRKGPMWGCLKALFWVIGGTLLVLLLIIGGGWWYLGTTNFADLVRVRIEETLENRLGREVTIGRVVIVRSRPQRVLLENITIANAPGGVAKHFAVVRQVEITGGVESFWGRSISVDRVDIRDPQMWFEIFPDGTHNFPKWKSGPKQPREIVHLEIGKLYVNNGLFGFLDRKHDIEAVAHKVDSTVSVTRADGLYEGLMRSPQLRVRLQEYAPFDLEMRGGFRYTPGILALRSIALKGRGIEAFLSGKIDPLTEAQYDFHLTSRLALERVREIFAVEPTLEGTIALDTRLAGKAGEFRLTGGWAAEELVADAYELADVKGTLDVTGDGLTVDVDRAGYGGGTIAADYVLSEYAEPYPMKVDLRYDGISLEQLFSDWGVEGTGLRGAATGSLAYRWNKEKILEGAGEGTARLAKSTTAFSNAQYPIGVAGSADFALDRGVVTFRRLELDTDASHVSATGRLKIEGIDTDLAMTITSNDFSELDRVAFNFARSAGKNDYELLGLRGTGTIIGTVKGPIETPQVVARATGSGVHYNEVLLGNADLELRYDGRSSVLTFDRARFSDGTGTLALNGTIRFPESGPGPVFDIAVEANGYPAQRAIDAVGLDLQIGSGLATGRMQVAGTPETGRATFDGLTIRRADATLALGGTINWLPGEGNVAFDLDIAATDFPVGDIAAFLDFGDLPLTGNLTGTLKIAGRKEALEGAGSVTIREGAIMGEPIDLASADIVFTEGRMRATNVLVQAAAGEIRGEAEVDLASERFSYTISSSSIDLSRIELLAGLRDLFGGQLILESTGAGTFTQPELVVEARIAEGTLTGLSLPPGAPPPSLYIAIRNGRMIVRGGIADVVSIDGEGTVGENMEIDGLVRVTVADLARALSISPQTATVPAAGNLVVDLRLSGRLTPLEQLVVEATAPVFDITIADHAFTTPQPLRVTLRNGRIEFDSFALQRTDSVFTVTGFAEITGAKRLDIDVRGVAEAAILQLFMTGVRADGTVNVAMSIDGTMSDPTMVGTAELRDAEVKFSGFPQLIDDINGLLRFRGDRIEIESLRATLGGGTVVAGGFITLDGMTPQSARITLQGSEVAIRYYEGVTVEGNFTLLLTGDLERAMLQGDVDVTRALYYRDFDIQQTLLDVLLARSRALPTTAATWQDRIGLRIHLSAPETLEVDNNLAELNGSADLDVTGTIANPVIIGEVTLDEGGRLRIQNVDYRLVRGTIAFQNPFRIDPFIDVTFEGTVSGFGTSEVEGGPYEVTVNLTGTLDRLTPSITSDPPASDITLFSLLGLGGIGSRDGTAQPGLGILGESLLYSSLSSLIGSRVFPFVDSFTYDPGTLDASGGSSPRVMFEKRLSNKVRVLMVYNLDNQQSRQVIEWLVNPTWTLQLTRDETDEYRLDARFRRRFDGQWTWGDDEEVELASAASMTTGGPARAIPPAPRVTDVTPQAVDGRPIAQINFRADAEFDTAAMAEEVTLQPGGRVSIREVQTSIRNLFATGNFRDIRVDAADAAEGVVLTFSLYLHYRLDEIEIVGLENRSDRNRARRELTIRAGEILSLDNVDDSAAAIEEMLHQQGFLEATVDPETNFDRTTSLADVQFTVEPGPLAKVSSVEIEGDTAPFTKQELIDRMTRSPGRVFHLEEAREDADRMKNHMVRRDYRRADVDFLGYEYDRDSNTVALRYRIAAGPKVQVAVSGVPRNTVRRWLPFARNQEYSEDVVVRAADRIVEGLQMRGHYEATVDVESSLEDGVWTTTFDVSPGPRYRLTEVGFSGNQKIDEDALQGAIVTAPRGGIRGFLQTLFRRPSGVTAEQLSDDQDSLETFYRFEGFSEATVGDPIVTTRADGTMTVEFPIVEGPQTLVSQVVVEGNDQILTDDLPRPRLRAGEPLNPQTLHDDVVALQTRYANRGYVEVQVISRVATSDDKTSAAVTYVIAEGPQVDINSVVVRGNTYTDRDVVLRRSNLEPGQPFNYTRLLEAQRELYRLGIFQRVEVQSSRAETTTADRGVVIRVEEGRNLTLTGSVGLRAQRGQIGEGLQLAERFSGAIAHRNLFGTGRYLGLEGVYSGDEREAYLTFREPFISRWNVPVQLQLFQTDDSTRAETRIRQRGTSIEATKVAGLQARWSTRYEYKISECLSGELCDVVREGKPVESLDRSLLDIEISSVSQTVFWDRRNDIIDPRRGFFTSASVEYAFPFISADTGFLKEFLQGAWYLPVSARTTIALSGRVGLIQPYAEKFNEDLGRNTLVPVPLSERFTAGGETTHRAFALDRLGNLCIDKVGDRYVQTPDCEPTLYAAISEDGMSIGPILPLGGNSMLLFNAEYRFPIFGDTFGGAVFADVGNVYAGTRIRFDELRYGAGIGFRYLSPVGPLRVDVAMPFERRWYEDSIQYFLTLGYAF